jgi:transcriptional regulator with XRE-family HTH domain
MSKIHIGKKIKEALKKSPLTMVEFAQKINLTRDGAYKIFEKETIAADQLQKISKVLNHDFFSYYQNQLNIVSDNNQKYGFATKDDFEALTRLVNSLAKDIEKVQQDIAQIADAQTKKKKVK